MTFTKQTFTRAFACLVVAICALPALAADSIAPGYDLWQTVGGGATAMDFRETPIPAGFFCEGSAAFDGRIDFDGEPLVTDPPGAFGSADTIIQRLDVATFKNGIAHSRIRASALNLVSIEPVSSGCGEWVVHASLASDQPVTDIMYKQETETSGAFFADLVLSVKLTFTNINNKSEVRTMERTVHFTEFHEAPYVLADDVQIITEKNDMMATTAIDFDGDGQVDAPLPLTTIAVGVIAIGTVLYPGYICPYPMNPPQVPPCVPLVQWHQAPLHAHVTLPPCGTSAGGWCQQGGVRPIDLDHVDDFEIIGVIEANTGILRQLKNLETRGVIKISAEELYENLVSKTLQ